MNHVSSTRLREYTFDLLPEASRIEIADHLEHCPDCQQAFQALEAQFQSLEVLRDQPEVSDDRLNTVLAAGRKVDRSKVIFFRPLAILTAVASIAICFMLFRTAGVSPAPIQSRPTDRTAGVSPAPQKSRRAAGGTGSLAELRATQPFAPASNIELNVLPRRDEVQLTIYNAEDLTLVRETRKMTLKRGWNWLQFMWSETLTDPTSLELEPKTHADQIEITQLVYPPRLNELARWTIFSEYSGEAEFELTYLTSGLKWNATYEATLAPDEQTMQLKSRIRVDNGSGEDYENAETRLVVGEINLEEPIAMLARRKNAYGKHGVLNRSSISTSTSSGNEVDFYMADIELFGMKRVGYEDMEYQKKVIIKKALSEYQLYTIEGRETIPDGWGKRLPNIEAQEIGVTNLYKFEAERWGNQTMRFLSFANTEACQLGETPLPAGQVRVFKNVAAAFKSSAGTQPRSGVGPASSRTHQPGLRLRLSPGSTKNLVYMSAARLQYIPIGENVELELGPAEKVTVEPKLMRIRSENFKFDAKGNISGWDEITNWKIEITNTKALPVKVEIMRWANSNHWNVETDETVEKYDAMHFRFMETVKPQRKRIIEYKLRVLHGTRAN